MAKPLKDGDAKLEGLRFKNDASQLPNTTTPAIYVNQQLRGFSCVENVY